MSTVILVPGLRNSGPDHWQSRWQRQLPDSRRVEQPHWDIPDLDVWTGEIRSVLDETDGAWIIAHSFGCLAAVQAVRNQPRGVRGLFLVAPADPEKFGIAHRLPHSALPVPGLVIASNTDPWLSAAQARLWASRWGFALLNAGDVGHINAESGHGNWPRGWFWFQQWQARVALRSATSRLTAPRTATWQHPAALAAFSLSSLERSFDHELAAR